MAQSPDPIRIGYIAIRIIGASFLFIIVISTIFGGFYSIDEGERGIQLRGGQITGVATPGFHFKMPWLESVEVISTRTERLALDKVAAYSKDQQVAELRISVNYRYDPASVRDIYTRYGTEGYPTRILQPRVLEATKTVFGQFNAVTAIQDRERMNAQIKTAVVAVIKDTGAEIEGVLIENIDFSDAYEESIEKRMQAEVEVQRLRQGLEQDKVNADRTVITARAQGDAERARAQAEADAIKFRAAADAESTKLRGIAEASSIDARGQALRNNPDLIRLIQAERWNGTLPTHMVPGSAVPFISVDK